MRFLLAIALMTALVSCGTSDSETKSETETAEAETQTPKVETAPVKSSYTLSPLSPSPEFPKAKLTSMKYDQGKWSFKVSGGDYKLGVQTSDAETKGCANSAQGQHIHLILGSDPYLAKYESEFDYEIEDGKKAVLAFLSRSYHESIKTADAHIAQMIYVQDNKMIRSQDIVDPMVFYSRPKGIYEGADTEKIMLDYYMVNTDKTKHYVKADINGEEFDLKDWQPYVIEGLPAGDNTITLTLMDENGPVKTMHNPVSRTFKVNP